MIPRRACGAGYGDERNLLLSRPEKDKTGRRAEYSVFEVGHPEFFQALKDWRAERAGEAGVPNYRILHQSVLIQIAATPPDGPAALMRIKGIGKRFFEKYGKELLALVSSYRQEHRIGAPARPALPAAPEPPANTGRPAAIDTRQVTCELFD
jgi:superfamily II DNA helicase RecQ